MAWGVVDLKAAVEADWGTVVAKAGRLSLGDHVSGHGDSISGVGGVGCGQTEEADESDEEPHELRHLEVDGVEFWLSDDVAWLEMKLLGLLDEFDEVVRVNVLLDCGKLFRSWLLVVGCGKKVEREKGTPFIVK